MDTTIYDYAIVGAGAAGLHLALAFLDDPYFSNKDFLIIEKNAKDSNDRTWCFWEKGPGKWDSILHQSWNKSEFITNTKRTNLDLIDYNYKMIRAIDFYTLAKSKLKTAKNFQWIQGELMEMDAGSPNLLRTAETTFQARHVFDSVVPPAFFNKTKDSIYLLQHFKGWVIETEKKIFNPDSFVMMDFRIKYPNSTCFTYILPQSANKALVEFTFFSPSLVKEEEYDEYLKKYINEILQPGEYRIVESEKGIIPMSNFPFHEEHDKTMTKIGTAGGWVKASSGYSFKNAERYSKKIIQNIKNNRLPSDKLFAKRFKWYDTIFLDVLYSKNHLGEKLFDQMYTKNDIKQIFAFLDEETTIIEEIKIISSFSWKPFIFSLLRHLR